MFLMVGSFGAAVGVAAPWMDAGDPGPTPTCTQTDAAWLQMFV